MLHLRWVQVFFFSFLFLFLWFLNGALNKRWPRRELDFIFTPLLCITSLWAKSLSPLLHLMQWTTALSLLLVSPSSCYKRWGIISIRSSTSLSLVINTFAILILWLIASQLVFSHLPSWCCTLSAVNTVMQIHVAIIVPSLFIFSYFSSCLLFGGRWIGRRGRIPTRCLW